MPTTGAGSGMSGATVIPNSTEALSAGDSESVTCAVNDEVPTAVGVPAICPLLVSARPGGNDPEANDHVNGVDPPVASRDAAYLAPTLAAGREAVVTATGGTALNDHVMADADGWLIVAVYD